MISRFSAPLLLSAALLLAPLSAWAHATPTAYEPEAASVLEKAPGEIRIRFSERVDPAGSFLTVYAPDGTLATVGAQVVDPADRHVFSLPLLSAGTGTYAVSWQVLSADDGHVTKGAFGFSVGVQTGDVAASGFQILHRSSFPEAVTIWLELLGHAMLAGVLVAVWVMGKLGGPADPRALGRLRWMLGIGAVCSVIGVPLWLWLKAIDLQTTGTTLSAAFGQIGTSTAGLYALLRMGIAAVMGVLLLLGSKFVLKGKGHGVWLLTAFLILEALLRARVSHAAASSTLPALSVLVNAVHLLAKSAWIGGVLAFTVCLAPCVRGPKHAVTALSALARPLMGAFGVGAATGCYILWLHLKAPGNLFATHWGMLCLALGALAAVLLATRLYQMLVVTPALSDVAGGKPAKKSLENAQSAGALLIAESIAALLVLLFSSWLVITTPPVTTGAQFRLEAESQGATVRLGADPHEDRQMLLEFLGTPPVIQAVMALTNEAEGIGPLVAPLMRRSEQTWVFPLSTLTPAGEWKAEITGQRGSAYDVTAAFRIVYPQDIDAAREAARTHGLGWTVFWLAAAVVATAIAAVVGRYARRCEARASRLQEGDSAVRALRAEKPWAVWPMVAVMFVFLSVQILDHGHGWFQRECRRNAHYWHESVPMRDGQALSTVSAMGCMLGMGGGQYHVTDPREYAWLMRPAGTLASLRSAPATPAAGTVAALSIAIRDGSGAAVTGLRREHDRILHVVAIGRDLKTFEHLHAEDAGPVTREMLETSTFPVRMAVPAAGRYLLSVDYSPRGTSVTQNFYLSGTGSPAMADPDTAPVAVSAQGGDTVTLGGAGTLTAGRMSRLTFRFTSTGGTVEDLEPYLAAPMHVAMVSSDLLWAQHLHAELPQQFFDRILTPRNTVSGHVHQYLPDRFGPDMVLYAVFPQKGTYVLFGQYRREGQVRTARFVVEVR